LLHRFLFQHKTLGDPPADYRMHFRLIVMFAADAHHGNWSRRHFVFQVQAVRSAA
jgi:hypothetical protein